MDTNKGLCPRNCRLVSALICPEMQGNKKPIFFTKVITKRQTTRKKAPQNSVWNQEQWNTKKLKTTKNKNKKKQQQQDREALHFWKPVTIEPQ